MIGERGHGSCAAAIDTHASKLQNHAAWYFMARKPYLFCSMAGCISSLRNDQVFRACLNNPPPCLVLVVVLVFVLDFARVLRGGGRGGERGGWHGSTTNIAGRLGRFPVAKLRRAEYECLRQWSLPSRK